MLQQRRSQSRRFDLNYAYCDEAYKDFARYWFVGLDESEKIRTCFSAELRRRRMLAKLSQDDLSARTGLAQSYISLLEHGNRIPGLDSFFRIARALKIKPTTLLAEIEKRM